MRLQLFLFSVFGGSELLDAANDQINRLWSVNKIVQSLCYHVVRWKKGGKKQNGVYLQLRQWEPCDAAHHHLIFAHLGVSQATGTFFSCFQASLLFLG